MVREGKFRGVLFRQNYNFFSETIINLNNGILFVDFYCFLLKFVHFNIDLSSIFLVCHLKSQEHKRVKNSRFIIQISKFKYSCRIARDIDILLAFFTKSNFIWHCAVMTISCERRKMNMVRFLNWLMSLNNTRLLKVMLNWDSKSRGSTWSLNIQSIFNEIDK